MNKILVIGSAVVDVVIDLDHLPGKSEDVHVLRQQMRLGGCAYNVSDMIRHFGVPYIPFFPVGGGAYGAFVRDEFQRRKIQTPIPALPEENGCCYCFVEADGERTFVSYHGAEYRFLPEWFSLLDCSQISSIYICGLEIEEDTGVHIVRFLEAHPQIPVYFAPGPRLGRIDRELMERLFALHPILHLNQEEACSYTGLPVLASAAARLRALTGNTVIVTLGPHGCYYDTGTSHEVIPGEAIRQTDTIGAGDAHIGALMACLEKGLPLREAIRTANRIGAAVVQTSGALLPDDVFRQAVLSL